MKFKYCPQCGEELKAKVLGDEGEVPFCEKCSRPWFEHFSTCVIVLVINEEDEVALLRQGYVSEDYYVCVAGYIQCGETAEATAVREVGEELGLKVEELNFTRSYAMEKKDMLMLAFEAHVKKAEFTLSQEVDRADWMTFEEAHAKMRPGSVAIQLVETYFSRKDNSEKGTMGSQKNG